MDDDETTDVTEHVTAACFSEMNDLLFIGTSAGMIRFVNLQNCLKVTSEEDCENVDLIAADPYCVERPTAESEPTKYYDKPITNL